MISLAQDVEQQLIALQQEVESLKEAVAMLEANMKQHAIGHPAATSV